MVTKLAISDFLLLAKSHVVFDVRSPDEYDHAHIPNAHSLPLFSDEERKVVGTAYKQEGKQQAIRIGLEYFGKKMVAMVDEVTALCKSYYATAETTNQIVFVHCWRGGMRSAGVAWLLDLYGFKVYTLVGGYKAYRNWVLKQFEADYNIRVLGGYTGSGKSEILMQLRQSGEAVIDLEAIAQHKGSAFGGIDMPAQPSQEMFENLLAESLVENAGKNDNIIWLEDESRRIGKLVIPLAFFNAMRSKSLYFISIPFEERLQHIVLTYGTLNKVDLKEAIERIQKRLGGLETKNAINFFEEDDIASCFRILLTYYDKCYLKAMHNRENIKTQLTMIEAVNVDANANATLLLHTINAKK